MASSWIRVRRNGGELPRFMVAYRIGGRSAGVRSAGTFPDEHAAQLRRDLVLRWMSQGKDPKVELARIEYQSTAGIAISLPGDDVPPDTSPLATTVYVARERAGRILYVGITGRNLQRIHAHAKSSKWWRRCDTIELFHFKHRWEAEDRERELIVELRPAFNVRHNNGDVA